MGSLGPSEKMPRFNHENLTFDPSLHPTHYEIAGTPPDSLILIRDVQILDSTGRLPYPGSVLIRGSRFAAVGTIPNLDLLLQDPNLRIIEGHGRTLMSGLGDAHAHPSWNNCSLDRIAALPLEEHVLATMRNATTFLDSGYTMCFGAAAAKDRLDVVVRDAINSGQYPGPRFLANSREIAVPDGELQDGITAFASGPAAMRETVLRHVEMGADQIKLSMSGEEICQDRAATDCYFTEAETRAAVDAAHAAGKRVCSHARARDAVIQSAKCGVDVIYHASYTDPVGMELLEANKHRLVVAPALNWLVNMVHHAGAYGFPVGHPVQVAYAKELDVAITALREMHRRGICILPGGDYGFTWCPHGTYARDLWHFVELLGFSPMEAVVAATAGVARLMGREGELGKVCEGILADCILVDGDVLGDVRVLQERRRLKVIVINGRVHKFID